MRTQLLVALLALAIAGQASAVTTIGKKGASTHETEVDSNGKKIETRVKSVEEQRRHEEIASGFRDLVGGADTIKLILMDAASRGKEAEMAKDLKALKEAMADSKVTEAQKKEVTEFLSNLVEYSTSSTHEQATTIELMVKSLPGVLKKGGDAAKTWTERLAKFNQKSRNRAPVGEALDFAVTKEEQAKIRKECV